LAFAFAFRCLAPVAGAQSYSYTPIDVPPELGFQTNPTDVSDSGVVVGDYYTSAERPCDVGFELRHGVFETFKHPDAACSPESDLHTAIAGVNDAGDIVGFYQSATRRNTDGRPVVLGFARVRGTLTDVEVPGSAETYAIGIDERGRIVGWYSLADDDQRLEHGFLLDEAGYHSVDAPGAERTWLYRINARGEMVGSYMDASNVEHGFVYRPTSFTLLEYPGDIIATIPWGIASNGRIAGYAMGEDCQYVCGFVWEGGAFQLLTYPDASETHPAAINARGVIVGAYIDTKGEWRGFMAQPH
jgi:uncharacterized membrane protein